MRPRLSQKKSLASVLTMLTALTIMAQVTGAGQSYGKPAIELPNAGKPMQASQHRLLPGAGSAPLARSPRNRVGVAATNPNDPLFLAAVNYSSGYPEVDILHQLLLYLT